jgi:hypothetical protein
MQMLDPYLNNNVIVMVIHRIVHLMDDVLYVLKTTLHFILFSFYKELPT